MTAVILAALDIYQRFVSPLLHGVAAGPAGCRFFPTCSAYGVLALRQYGLRRGFVVLLQRIARCHPWAIGGYDPLP